MPWAPHVVVRYHGVVSGDHGERGAGAHCGRVSAEDGVISQSSYNCKVDKLVELFL